MNQPKFYPEIAPDLLSSGWIPLPLPAGQKASPPHGYTGAGGVVASGPDVYAWVEAPEHAQGNTAVRMPLDVVGLDVDQYVKDGRQKIGYDTWLALCQTHGEPPQTWVVTSRDDGMSGVRLYRLPTGVDQADLGGGFGGIDVLRWGHRYMVAPGSLHPDTGQTYRCYREETGEVVDLPHVGDLPVLPRAWFDRFVKTAQSAASGSLVQELVFPTGAPCQAVSGALLAFLGALQTSGTRHDTARDAVLAIVRLGEQGHTGADRALKEAAAAFMAEVGADPNRRAGDEFRRMVDGAVALVLANPTDIMEKGCCRAVAPALPAAGEVGPATATADWEDIRVAQIKAEERARRRAKAEMAVENRTRERAPLRSVSAILAEPPIDQPWLVDGLFAVGSRVMITAQAKAGKTTMVLGLARSLLTGEKFLGRYEVEPLAAGETVVFLDFEVHQNTFRGWAEKMGLDAVADRLYRIGLRGEVNPFSDEESQAWLVEQLREVGCRVLLIDPFAMAYGATEAGSENDNSAVAAWWATVNQIATEAGVGEVVLVAHAGKGASKSARGASALEGIPDALWYLTVDETETSRIVSFEAKGRDVDVEKQIVTWDETNLRQVVTGLTRNEQRAMDKQAEAAVAQSALVNQIVKVLGSASMNTREIMDALGIREYRDVNPALAMGVQTGMLAKEQRGRSYVYSVSVFMEP